jgi:ABC-2 type transport system permease protein
MEGKSKLRKNWEWIKALFIRNGKAILEYKKAIFIESFSMLLTNFAFVFVWYFVFQKYGNLNGWGFEELFLLDSFTAFLYGICTLFSHGMFRISRNVTMGQVDQYLTQPKSVLLNLIFSEAEVSAIGDIVEGLVVFILYVVISGVPITKVPIFFILIIFGIILWVGFIIATQSIVFWLPNSEELSSTLMNITLGTALYPNKAFQGFPRIFFTWVLPSALIGTIPADIFINPNLRQILILVGMSMFWITLGIFLFNKGLKKYESGNVFGRI